MPTGLNELSRELCVRDHCCDRGYLFATQFSEAGSAKMAAALERCRHSHIAQHIMAERLLRGAFALRAKGDLAGAGAEDVHDSA